MENLNHPKDVYLLPSAIARKLLKPTYEEVVIQQKTTIATARYLQGLKPKNNYYTEAEQQAQTTYTRALISMRTIATLCKVSNYVSIPLDFHYPKRPIIAVLQYYQDIQQEAVRPLKAA